MKEIWGLVKPVIIIVLSVIGYFWASNFVTRNLFLAIIGLSIVFRGRAIWDGFVNIYNAFKKE